MRMKLLLSGLTIVALGASIVFAHPGVANAETAARFQLGCKFSHQRRADPIVSPGRRSMHMHDFFGNSSTNARSTYRSMLAASTTCGLSTDTAAYWSPSLVRPSGRLVQPVKMSVYYRNDPATYRTTRPFPRNFRVIAGGVGTYPHFFWNCARDDSSSRKLRRPPECGSDRLVAHVRFPNCSDGRIDSRNHRRHLAYPVRQRCPATHPTKLPFLVLTVHYPGGASGPGYELSDGTVAPHMDFWNTWNQTVLVRLVRRCLQRGIGCGMQAD